jgi:hypothetical protein
MMAFRCYFLDAHGHIKAAEWIEDAAAVDAAIAKAFFMLRERPDYAAVEVWHGAKRVYAPRGPKLAESQRL